MTLGGVEAGRLPGRQPIVDVPPMIGRGVTGIDARSVHGVDRREHGAHLWPALNREIEFAAGLHEGRRRVAPARPDRPQAVATRMDRPAVLGGTAHGPNYGAAAAATHSGLAREQAPAP